MHSTLRMGDRCGLVAGLLVLGLASLGCARSSLKLGGGAQGTAGSGGSGGTSTSTTSSSTSSSGGHRVCADVVPWSLRLGGTEDLESTDAVHVLPDCTALIGGVLRTPGGDPPAGLFLQGIDPTGQTTLALSWGDGEGNLLRGIGSDDAGRIVVAGEIWGSIDFGGGVHSSSGQWDMVLASFEADGSYRWSALYGGPDYHETSGLAVDPEGNMVLAGQVSGAVDFGGGLLVPAGIWDIALASFDAQGNHRWSRLIGSEISQTAPEVALTDKGLLWVGGWFHDDLDLGLGPMIATGDDAYLAVFDEQGAAMTGLQITGESTERIEAVAAALDGGAVVAGRFTNSMMLPYGDVFGSAGQGDAFVMRVDETATVRWAVPIGGEGDDAAWSVAIDDEGRVVVAGTTDGRIQVGGQLYEAAGQRDIFVAVLDSGQIVGFALYGDEQNQGGPHVGAVPGGGYLLAGGFEGTIAFDEVLTSAGEKDAFAALVR